MLKKNSLKSRILIYFILFTIIPLIVGSAFLLYQMYKTKEQSVYNKHYQILKQVEEESDSIVSNIEYLGKYVKDKYPLKKHNLLTGLVRVQKNISTILILNNQGILKDFNSNIKINIFKGYDYSNTKYFLAIKNGLNDYWSDVYLSQTSSLPSISYSLRVDKNTIAVLIIDLSILHDFVKKFKSDDGTTMVRIIDKDGVFLAHPDQPEYVSQRKKVINASIYKKYISKDYKYRQIMFDGAVTVNNIGVYGITEKLKWYIIVKESYSIIFETFNTLIWFLGLFIILLIGVSIYFSIKLSKSILKPLEKVSLNMDNMAHDKRIDNISYTSYLELDDLVSNFLFMQEKILEREERVQVEIEKNKDKDIQLFEQSKMAAMGEMIGNIAHQWRQPLSVISTAATGMQLQKEYGMLSDELFKDSCISINKQAQYLSKTIDDFKNFIKGDRTIETFNVKDCIDSFLHLIESSIKRHNLQVVLDLDASITYQGYPNELKQCFINIFNNSKDALQELDLDSKLIFISISQENNKTLIKFKDNAGGIPEEILPKIFEPYFTTKHKSQGTGLGLNMTYNLIVDGMKGNIVASNVHYKYEDKDYDGAEFIISLS